VKICGEILGTDCCLDWGHDGAHEPKRLLITILADGLYTATCSACPDQQVGADMVAITRIAMKHARDTHGAALVDIHVCEPDPDGFSGWMMGCSTAS
jgi:hypothetical protein